jgi:hypothetical protein
VQYFLGLAAVFIGKLPLHGIAGAVAASTEYRLQMHLTAKYVNMLLCELHSISPML